MLRSLAKEMTPTVRPTPSRRPLALALLLILVGAWLLAVPPGKPASSATRREDNHAARIVAAEASPAPVRPSRHEPIETIRLGDRVHAEFPTTAARSADAGTIPGSGPSPDDEEVSPATWRRIDLVMTDERGIATDIALLRPTSWAESHDARPGRSIELSLPEMGAEGQAKVVAVGPCPEIRPGQGRVVTGTFTHDGSEVLDVRLEGSSGPIGVTPRHPFYSADRKRFVDAGSLSAGERLLTPAGDAVRVASVATRVGTTRVFNIEVHGTHVYFVSPDSVLVHNQSPADARFSVDSKGVTVDNKPNIAAAPRKGLEPPPVNSTVTKTAVDANILVDAWKQGQATRLLTDRQSGRVIGEVTLNGNRVIRYPHTDNGTPQLHWNLVDKSTGDNIHVIIK